MTEVIINVAYVVISNVDAVCSAQKMNGHP